MWVWDRHTSVSIVKLIGNVLLKNIFHTHLMLLFYFLKSNLYQRETGLYHENSHQTV